ncbi:hypothetical protein K431DRAFT_290637 [Polychaeton citri CBS 116435]|uniref:Uncharacterized protein n=1 Tax=Polychaeton citri CBS 116435 TaxID=1314669 RepID=A0A9P4QFK6_9PEZI|nr:hypothetical protein K431DRAFT_290637 [Polychaeton citri CBS 116435]
MSRKENYKFRSSRTSCALKVKAAGLTECWVTSRPTMISRTARAARTYTSSFSLFCLPKVLSLVRVSDCKLSKILFVCLLSMKRRERDLRHRGASGGQNHQPAAETPEEFLQGSTKVTIRSSMWSKRSRSLEFPSPVFLLVTDLASRRAVCSRFTNMDPPRLESAEQRKTHDPPTTGWCAELDPKTGARIKQSDAYSDTFEDTVTAIAKIQDPVASEQLFNQAMVIVQHSVFDFCGPPLFDFLTDKLTLRGFPPGHVARILNLARGWMLRYLNNRLETTQRYQVQVQDVEQPILSDAIKVERDGNKAEAVPAAIPDTAYPRVRRDHHGPKTDVMNALYSGSLMFELNNRDEIVGHICKGVAHRINGKSRGKLYLIGRETPFARQTFTTSDTSRFGLM